MVGRLLLLYIYIEIYIYILIFSGSTDALRPLPTTASIARGPHPRAPQRPVLRRLS